MRNEFGSEYCYTLFLYTLSFEFVKNANFMKAVYGEYPGSVFS